MVPDEKSDVMQVAAAPAEGPTLLPQCGIAALGVGLLALSFLQAIGVNCLVIPASALGGGAAVAARLFLRTPMRRHAHAARDRGTNRIA
jgi:hypothetical protein